MHVRQARGAAGRWALSALSDHQNRNRTTDKHLRGLAAEQKTAEPASAVGSHDDEIATSLTGGLLRRHARVGAGGAEEVLGAPPPVSRRLVHHPDPLGPLPVPSPL